MGREFNAPFPPILSHHAPNWLPEPVLEKLHPLRKGNMCVKVSDTVLPPITGLHITFRTYMKALDTMGREFNAPSPPTISHHAPNWLPVPVFEKLHPLWKGNMCEKVSDTVLPPITGLHITFRTYMKALDTMGGEFNAPFPPILSRHAPNWLPVPVFEILHPLRKGNMCEKVSDTVLPPITGLHITFGTYMKALDTMGGEFNAPFPPILSHHAPNWLPGPVFKKLHRTSEGKHVRESLRHGATTHNWFAHYLWDIYGGFGHNGKIIQRTLPSHTQPSRSKLAAWASFRETSSTSEGKHVRESLRHGVTTHNWFAHYLWDIYGSFGHNGRIIQRTFPSFTQPSHSKLVAWANFQETSSTSEGKHVRESLRHGVTTHNWFAHYLWDIYEGFGHNGKKNSMHPSPPILSHHAPNWLPGPDFQETSST